MSVCTEFEVLIALRAAGAADGEDGRLLDAHLLGCERCRREVTATATALRLAKAPPPAESERRAVVDLSERTLAAWERRHERKTVARRIAITAVVSVALLFALVVPFTLTHLQPSAEVASADGVSRVPPDGELLAPAVHARAAADVSDAWRVPDLDDLWADAAVVSADLAAEPDE